MNPVTIETTGSLLKSSWAFFKAHWQILASIIIIPNVLHYVAVLFLRVGNVFTVFLGAFIAIMSLILSVAMAGAIIRTVQSLSTDPTQKLSVYTQYKIGFGYFWPVVLLAIVSSFATTGGLLLLVVPGILMMVYGSMYAYALVIDEKRGFSAILESYSLVYGRFVAVFGRLFTIAIGATIIQIISSVLYICIALLFGVNIMTIAENHQQIPVLITLIGFILNLGVQAVVGPIAVVYAYRLYLSLKATRQPNVATKAFKTWFIIFAIVGPLFFIVLTVGSTVFVLSRLH